MKLDLPGLIINNKLYSLDDLPRFCNEHIQDPTHAEWEKRVYHFILELLDEKEYIVQRSSGTTGAPKEIKVSKQAMFESAKRTVEALELGFGQTALLCLPIDYIAGKMMVVRALVATMNLLIVEPSGIPSIASNTTIDFCAMVPLQAYNSFSNYEFFTNIKTLIIGGAEIRDELESMLRDLPNKTYETYGMSETSSHIALRRINGEAPEDCFTTITGVKVSKDKRDCLVVHANYITEEIVTNDVVEIIDDQHFRWLGRYDNMINSGGLKFQPETLEKEIGKYLEQPCAIIDKPDAVLGHKVVLVVESNNPSLSSQEVLGRLRHKIHSTQLPKEVYFVEKLPRNKSFKTDRTLLRLMIKEMSG